MSYFNLTYAFLFLIAVVIIYNLIPKKFRSFLLLIASYTFFFIISGKLILFLILSTLSIYGGAILIKHFNINRNNELENIDVDKSVVKEKYKKINRLVLIFTILLNVSFLFFFKYTNFFSINLNYIFSALNIDFSFKIIKHLAPIGISFYTLMAISYIIDVYKGKIETETNFVKLALYLSFFPTIVEGPIIRYSDIKDDLYACEKVNYKNFCFGFQRILYGFFKKLVIADRLNILVKLVFSNYTSYSGLSVLGAIISYTVLLYTEFSGTMDVVIGSAEIFGISVKENFQQPFFSKTIQEFWTRWHISLGLWFKDYIFYPISLSKPIKKLMLKTRKCFGNHYGVLITSTISLFVVWSLNGLWHGAGYTYLFYGMYHFTLITLGNILTPIIVKVCAFLKINRENIFYKILQNIKLIIFVLIGELFFRAPTVKAGFGMLGKVFNNFMDFNNGEFFSLGLDIKDFIIVLIALIVVLIVSVLNEKGIHIREKISKQNIVLRWLIYYALILAIIVFGAYGQGYIPVDPIYADF